MKSKYMLEEYRTANNHLLSDYIQERCIFSIHDQVFNHEFITIKKLRTEGALVNCIELCLRYRNCLLF